MAAAEFRKSSIPEKRRVEIFSLSQTLKRLSDTTCTRDFMSIRPLVHEKMSFEDFHKIVNLCKVT